MKVIIKEAKRINKISNMHLVAEAYEKNDIKTLRKLYFAEHGKYPINEAKLGDWAKTAREKIKSAGTTVTGAAKSAYSKATDYLAGIKDIGLGSGTTILGGEETLSMEKRRQKRSEAEMEVKSWLKTINQTPQGKELESLFNTLDKSGFPNLSRSEFDSEVGIIKSIYNKLKKDYTDSPSPEKLKATNNLVAVLRGIVVYFQDFKIADKYLYLKEQEEQTIGKKAGEGSKSYAAAYGAKLPLGLALAGVSAMALGYNAEELKGVLEKFKDLKDVSKESVEQALKADTVDKATKALEIGKGQGITQALGTATGVNLGSNAPLSNLLDPKAQEYLDSVKAAVVAKNGEAGGKAWDQILQMAKDPSSSGKSLGEIFKGPLAGTGKSVGDLLSVDSGSFQGLIKKAVQTTVKKAVTKAMKQPAETLKNQFIGGAQKLLSGPVLMGLGLGALAGAGVSAAMRAKGKANSRMNDLQQLVMNDLKDIGVSDQAATTALAKQQQQALADKTAHLQDVTSAAEEVPTGLADKTAHLQDVTSAAEEVPTGLAKKVPTEISKEIKSELELAPEDFGFAIVDGTGKIGAQAKITREQAVRAMTMMGLSGSQIEAFFKKEKAKTSGKNTTVDTTGKEITAGEQLSENKNLKKTYLLSEVKIYVQQVKQLERMKLLAGIK